jgi:hypothetical protein
MKTLTIKPKAMRPGQTHYLVPAKAAHGGPVPSLRLAIGKENQVPVADELHEAQLRADRNLEILEPGAEKKAEATKPPAIAPAEHATEKKPKGK